MPFAEPALHYWLRRNLCCYGYSQGGSRSFSPQTNIVLTSYCSLFLLRNCDRNCKLQFATMLWLNERKEEELVLEKRKNCCKVQNAAVQSLSRGLQYS